MKKNAFILFLLCLFFNPVYAFFDKERDGISDENARITILRIKLIVEKSHYREQPIDDTLSRNAFTLFIHRIDPSKKVFHQSDIDALYEEHATTIDDQLKNGDYQLVKQAYEIYRRRVKEVESIIPAVLQNPFDFTLEEAWEKDYQKITHVNSGEEHYNRWRMYAKHSALDYYLTPSATGNQDKDWGTIEEYNQDTVRNELTTMSIKKPLDFFSDFVNAVLGACDRHSHYTPPTQQELTSVFNPYFAGIGISFIKNDRLDVEVIELIPGAPAWLQGQLDVGDIITAVAQEGKAPIKITPDMTIFDAVKIISGKKGTRVTLTAKKQNGEIKDITITRDIVRNSEYKTMSSVLRLKAQGDGREVTLPKVGYIRIPAFYRSTGYRREGFKSDVVEDVASELELLMAAQVEGVIVDLRNNAGGIGGIDTAGLFLGERAIVQQVHSARHAALDRVLFSSTPLKYPGPLIIMVNGESTSEAERFALAIKDYGRGIIVGGNKTNGKGTIIVELLSGPNQALGMAMITVAKFYGVKGTSPHIQGVVPHIRLPILEDYHTEQQNKNADSFTHPLPEEVIDPMLFMPWGRNYQIPRLQENSRARVSASKEFQRIENRLAYLKRRDSKTTQSLHLETAQYLAQEDRANLEENEIIPHADENVLVSGIEESFRLYQNIAPENAAQWEREFKRRRTLLQEDIYLRESLHIMYDILALSKNK